MAALIALSLLLTGFPFFRDSSWLSVIFNLLFFAVPSWVYTYKVWRRDETEWNEDKVD